MTLTADFADFDFNLVSIPDPFHESVADVHNPIRDIKHLQVVCRRNYSDALLCIQAFNEVNDLTSCNGIQVRRRFIGEDNARIVASALAIATR